MWLKLAARYPMVTLLGDLVWDRVHGSQEQFYDSQLEKARLHFDFIKNALFDKKCPLDKRRLPIPCVTRIGFMLLSSPNICCACG